MQTYMTKLIKIRDMLSKYEELFQFISDIELDTHPCMDVSLDENDYYGADFFGKQRVCQLFFTGSSDYFPAIWIGENENNIDKMHVFILDLSDSDNIISEPLGNVRQYVTKILDDFLKHCNNNKKDDQLKQHKQNTLNLKKELSKLSNEVIDKGNYVLKISDE
jgi:hypothetical protein